MKPPLFKYFAPESLDEALQLRATYGSDSVLLSGGQSVMPLLNMRLARPAAVIDLNRVRELAYIRVEREGVHVGAMTRQRHLERSDAAADACPLLRETLTNVAHPVIRNRGTVGGSIAHADPAAELPATLVALKGEVVAKRRSGVRVISAEEFFQFHFTTRLESDEIVVEVFFPRMARQCGYAFVEFARRHGDFALAGAAVILSQQGARIALAGVGPTPIPVETDDPADAARVATPGSDIHGSEDYRRALVQTICERALGRANERLIANSNGGKA